MLHLGVSLIILGIGVPTTNSYWAITDGQSD